MILNVMKVLLINPNSIVASSDSTYSRFVPPVAPTGIAYLAGLLEKNGVEVSIIDQYANKMTGEDLIKRINVMSPQLVGFSCLTPAMKNVKMLVEQIRLLKKDIKIILGNIHATLFADELLKKGLADIIIRGEGEIGMLEVTQALEKGRSLHEVRGISFIEGVKVCHNPDREPFLDLDDLPYPAWHLFDLEHYKTHPMVSLYDITLPIQASRGCPYQCIFCSQDAIYKKPRHRKNANVINEIEYIYNHLGVNHFVFIDAYFPFSVEHGLEFCNEFIRRGLHKKIVWVTETRVDKVNLELLKKMKEAGLHLIMYGFEVGNQQVLDSLRKKTTLEQARQAMRNTKKAGIRTLGLFVLGMPGETKATCEDTIRFSQELDCDIAKFNIAVPLPGSKFFEDLRYKLGNITDPEKFTSWSNWASPSNDLIYVPDGMRGKELVDLQRKAMFQFFVRPKLIIRYILKRIVPLRDLCFGARMLIKICLGNITAKIMNSKK